MRVVYSFISLCFVLLIGIGIDGIFQLIPYSDYAQPYLIMTLYYFFVGGITITILQKLYKEHK